MKGEGEKTRIEKEMLRKGKSTAEKSKAIHSNQSTAENSKARGTKKIIQRKEKTPQRVIPSNPKPKREIYV